MFTLLFKKTYEHRILVEFGGAKKLVKNNGIPLTGL
jgi:hypothetical protein